MEEHEEFRIRTPQRGEVLGIIESLVGSNKLKVFCQDNKMRLCRIPGKMRKKIWMREGDAVLVKIWEIQGDSHGDIVYKYNPTQSSWLKRKGLLVL